MSARRGVDRDITLRDLCCSRYRDISHDQVFMKRTLSSVQLDGNDVIQRVRTHIQPTCTFPR